jgi:L-gulonolactone oxidase
MLSAVAKSDGPVIAHGLGRSYGDVALNEGGTLLLTRRLDSLISADWSTGRVRAYAGLSLAELHRVSIPKGWFAAVTPGTKYVTLGGAVANDVHGKNHHQAGSFGAHVISLKLNRSDGEALICNPNDNSDLFALTTGGLGLTGLIEWVELQLKPIASSNLHVENIPCPDLSTFFELSKESSDWPYTVMWVDCFAPGEKLGRGVFSRARPANDGVLDAGAEKPALKWPVETPGFLLSRQLVSLFNALYRLRPGASFKGLQSRDAFFYPLDGVRDWNKLYGRQGFFQHQSILPMEEGERGVRLLLETIRQSGQGSFLAVLKVHGPESSPGVMSFCREGVSLALDFANKGEKTLKFLDALDEIVQRFGGRVYPAKDGRMSARFFKESYPRWRELEAARDPQFSSSFWRRVAQTG